MNFCLFVVCTVAYSLLLVYISGRMRRSVIAESLLNKFREDEMHKVDQHTYWYEVDLNEIDEYLKDKFIQLHQDEETEEFLANCYDKSDRFLYQLWHSLVIPIMKLFMTQTNINGYLNRGSMFVFSNAQFRSLLQVENDWHTDSLLDLGAGDGKVTSKMARHFSKIYTTEAATQMQQQLAAKGFELLPIDAWANKSYDVITCLNLLDRCDKPMQLLQDMRSSIKPDGYVLVASVSPYSPYVELNSSNNHQPLERLPITARSIEGQVNETVKNIFEPCGFELFTFSRLPYLCEGDMSTSFYVLHDIIFVLRPK